ncbi:MAG TPA: CAP domain-containing protein [Thermoanaerobaculia bacterium]|nr:CAP domain-containing protein [Thermoanaerobaculia bacterium]
MLRNVLGVLLTFFLVSPVFASDLGLNELDVRAGESIGGFPNWGERLLLTWINRARVDPQADLRACGDRCAEAPCYQPVAPLTWTPQLNRAARFHADEMLKQGYFGHDSRCRIVPKIDSLYPAGCDGAASCACVGGNATCPDGDCSMWSERVGLFGAQASGEVIALGASPDETFYMWLHESSQVPACGPNGDNIHRWLILSQHGAVGLGYNDQNRAAVGDFGFGPAPYRIPSGSHFPRQAHAVELWANWYDTTAPQSAAVVVDGECTSMSLERGTAKNGAWSATVTGVGSGCHRYYFSFIDASGREVTYPATGSLGIGCEDWESSRQTASCSVTTTPATPSPVVPSRRRAAGRR